jgi:hypothetical protein
LIFIVVHVIARPITLRSKTKRREAPQRNADSTSTRTLPSEILGAIFLYLSFDDLVTCRETCAHWQLVIEDYQQLRDMVFRGRKDLFVAERMHRIVCSFHFRGYMNDLHIEDLPQATYELTVKKPEINRPAYVRNENELAKLTGLVDEDSLSLTCISLDDFYAKANKAKTHRNPG